ncbi:MAG: hypothetical protein JWQ55_3152, partial [Rhodopila sp.]|nr:hypothetical protein [Rhodopila sp.]
VTLPATFGVSLRPYWIVDDHEVCSAARYGSPDANRKILTAARRRPRVYRVLVLCDTKPEVLLPLQDERTYTSAEMLCEAE